MKNLFLISAVVSILVTACSGQKNAPTVFPTLSPEQSFTATATLPSTPTKIQPSELSSPPTSTPFPPYQIKNVILDYYVVGNQADWDEFFDPPKGNIVTRLILYEDGQLLIAGDSEKYQQKILSSDQIKSFLSNLETLGFYSLNSNQKHDTTDKLYDFGNNYQKDHGGLWYCILVKADKSKNLCIKESYIQFLIPEMKKILQFLDTYQPAEMQPYYPDRILLTIQIADPSVENPPAIPWDERFPSLEKDPKRYTSGTSNQVVYIDGDLAKEIYLFFEGAGERVVSQDGKEYIVYLRVLLPHEKVKNPQP
jgi:hypothetical protein